MNDYLPEDQDLLDELRAIGPMSTGSALVEQQRRIQEVQIKAALRTRKTASDSEKSTSRFSVILAAFALVQIVIALSQLVFSFVNSDKTFHAIVVSMILIVAVIVILKSLDPNKLIK